MRLLGAHMSIAGGVDKAVERGLSIGCTAIQIFVKNNNQWFGKAPELKTNPPIFIFAHTGYLINLATIKPENLENSLKSMRQELDFAEAIGLPFTVLHPGAHLGAGEDVGIGKVADNLKTLLKETSGYKVKVALENTSGQGSSLGYKFEHLAKLLELIGQPERMGVCFDTCHAFASGYDVKEKTWEEFDRIVGLKNLLAIHLNDSKGEQGSKKDRHEHIGQGKMGLEPFRLLMNDSRFDNIPMVLETPKDPDLKQDVMNLKLLRSLVV
ncbi:MAG: deoxyribonuclease IV [bacterium]